MTDASAAIGIAQRTGIGRTRHIDTDYLWIQQKQWEDRLAVGKVCGKLNPADAFTKAIPEEVMVRHLKSMGFEFKSGRAEKSVKLVEGRA
jgi:hypothetical protein